MGRIDIGRLGRAGLLIAVAALAVFVTAWLGVLLTRFGDRIASVWIANALLVVFLVRFPNRWALLLPTGIAANTAANLIGGDPAGEAIMLSLFNGMEAVLLALPLARHFGSSRGSFEARMTGTLLIHGGIVAPAVTAATAAAFLSLGTIGASVDIFTRWYLADALGLLIFTPLFLAIPTRWSGMPRLKMLIEPGLTLGLLAAATAVIFMQPYPLLYILLAGLVFAGFRMSLGGAALAVALVSAIGTLLTLSGNGPIDQLLIDPTQRMFALQGFVAVAIFVTLPINVIIGERNRLLRSANRARDDANAAAEAKSNFLAVMGHEIRTPMTSVLGMIELLNDNPQDQERVRYLKALKQSAEMLTSAVNGILDLSRLESGRIEFVTTRFDMTDTVRGCVEMFQNVASGKGHDISLDIGQIGDSAVCGDVSRVQQVLTNLISTALKFTQSDGIDVRVRARARGRGRRWHVEIRDNGTRQQSGGQAPLVELFDAAGDRKFGATGIGLEISRRLIEAMGGKIGMRSRPGHGPTFWFSLDLPSAVPEALADSAGRLPAAPRPLHILIAEDNPINQLLVAALVRRLGYRATCVDNGRRAFEAAQAVVFDCILMDMHMPEMDGAVATRAIRQTSGPNRETPIFALTADAAPERRGAYDDIGLTQFLTKPVDVEALGAALRQIAAAAPARRAPVTAIADREAFDADRIAELHAMINPQQWESIVDLLRAELNDGPADLRRLAASCDLDQLRARAHSFKGAVANLGASGVACAAKAVELALPGTELELALTRLEAEAHHAVSQLSRLSTGPERRIA